MEIKPLIENRNYRNEHTEGLLQIAYRTDNTYPHRGCFNCWGFTLFMHGELPEPKWVDDARMMQYLRQLPQVQYGELQPGDIIAYFEEVGRHREFLIHTAIYLSDDVIVHKPGMRKLEISHAFKNCYAGNATIRYYRPQRVVSWIIS